VSVAFDTGQIPKADRAEAVRAAVAEHLVPVEIDFAADRGPAAAPLAITDLADLTVWTSTSNAVKVREEDIYNPDAMLKMLSWWCDVAGVPFPVPEIQG
jgi:hypothetical protein